ncbi:uncharacterized protein LOC144350859 [Saccoglossus kowalevskii]
MKTNMLTLCFCLACMMFTIAYGQSFIDGPVDVELVEHNTAILKCKIGPDLNFAEDAMGVLWYHGGKRIYDEESAKYKRITDDRGQHDLLIYNITEEDTGYYTCLVYDVQPQKAGKLTVIPYPVLTEEPINKTVIVGDTAILSCVFDTFSENHFDVFWLKDKTVITVNETIKTDAFPDSSWNRYFVTRKDDGVYLTITDVTLQDMADYSCGVANKLEEDFFLLSRATGIKVLIPSLELHPICFLHQNSRHYNEDDEVTANCVLSGNTAGVSLSFLKNGETMTDYKTQGNATYIRQSETWALSPKDDGCTLTCVVKTSTGTDNRICAIGPIDVRFSPIVEVMILHGDPLPGQNIDISCVVSANPEVFEYNWLINEQHISTINDTRFALRENGRLLTIIDPSTKYNGSIVTCQTHNAINASTATSTIMMKPWPTYVTAEQSTVGVLSVTPGLDIALHTCPSETLYIRIYMLASLLIVFVAVTCFLSYLSCRRYYREKELNRTEVTPSIGVRYHKCAEPIVRGQREGRDNPTMYACDEMVYCA